MIEDADYPDIAEHPVDPEFYRLIARSPHFGSEWERLNFHHRITGQMIYRRRRVEQDPAR